MCGIERAVAELASNTRSSDSTTVRRSDQDGKDLTVEGSKRNSNLGFTGVDISNDREIVVGRGGRHGSDVLVSSTLGVTRLGYETQGIGCNRFTAGSDLDVNR